MYIWGGFQDNKDILLLYIFWFENQKEIKVNFVFKSFWPKLKIDLLSYGNHLSLCYSRFRCRWSKIIIFLCKQSSRSGSILLIKSGVNFNKSYFTLKEINVTSMFITIWP